MSEECPPHPESIRHVSIGSQLNLGGGFKHEETVQEDGAVPSNSALSEGGHVSVNDTVEFGIHILQCSSETVCECENSIECPPKADLDKASNVQLTESTTHQSLCHPHHNMVRTLSCACYSGSTYEEGDLCELSKIYDQEVTGDQLEQSQGKKEEHVLEEVRVQNEDHTPPISTTAERGTPRVHKGHPAVGGAPNYTDETLLRITTADQILAQTHSIGSLPPSRHLVTKKTWKWRALFRKRGVDVSASTSEDNSPPPSSGLNLPLSQPIPLTARDAASLTLNRIGHSSGASLTNKAEGDLVTGARGHESGRSPVLSKLTKGPTEHGPPLNSSSREKVSARAVSPLSIHSGNSWRQVISDASSATSGGSRSCYYSMSSRSTRSGDPLRNVKAMDGIPSELQDAGFM